MIHKDSYLFINHTSNAVLRKKIYNNTAKKIQITNNLWRKMFFQPVFEGDEIFAPFNVYGNIIEYSGTRVCKRLHILS